MASSKSYTNETISSVWEKLSSNKTAVITRAEDCSKLTIPSIFPKEGFDDASTEDDVYQSLGARAVLNLAAKFMQTLFPTTATFFKLMPTKDFEEQILAGSDKTALDNLNAQLVKLETAITNEMERQSIRKQIHESLKLLIVTGNVCLWKNQGDITLFSLRNYVVKRDTKGTVLDLVLREKMSPKAIPDTIKLKNVDVDEITVYTRMVADGEGNYQIYQEVENEIIAGSEQTIKLTDPNPFIVLRWTATAGSSYGRGLVEHYLGDLRNYEAINMVIVDTASVMSRTVFLVNPNSQHGTDVDALNEAVTGDYIAGHADDITVPQTNKNSDLAVLLNYMQILETRLSQAFLLFTQRNAERVTAQEIRQVTQQLEETLGGIYTILAEDLQKPLLQNLMKELKIKLDKKIDSVITTGLDAIGRGSDANKLLQFLEMLGMIPNGYTYLNESTLVQRMAYSMGIAVDGLLKSPEQLQQEQQAQQQADMENQFGSAVAQQGGKNLADVGLQQQGA